MFHFVYLFFMALSVSTQAGLLYNYQELTMKDVEQMNQVIEGRIQESKKTKYGKIVPLKEGFQAVFSRPDHDGVIDKVITSLRSEIENLKGWEKTVTELTNEALNVLSNPRAFQPKVQVTYVVYLTNIINYFKTDLDTESFGKKIIVKISEKNIELTSSAKKELQLTAMKELVSPSELAK
ncbi:MAG TPA: hypothetical protein PLJ21_04270, partial [Pseudobdellovibrionaceae bacterium]|nr:hypothetical protein [Pseudobdellovibrionaceae bacterium]